MGGYRSVKDDPKCKITSVAVFPSATAADDVLATDAKSAAAEVHRAAARSVILPAQTEVSVTFISSATDDAADNIVVDEAKNNLLRSRESQQPQKLFLQPITQVMAYAPSRLALHWQRADMSVGILIGFDCLLRAGKLLQLRGADIR